MIYQYQIRLLIVIGESEWFLMVQKIISSLTTIILSIPERVQIMHMDRNVNMTKKL